ncbi:hypothetical protein PGT21_014785 [Puccinia graminis f. sp. tritici]|uniref:Uncharacterized protein n=1 Tax=Puccinia graminis f. sp. tritici TaxID=56615 RepID=A0A5B0P008_PUCGR|nr:hypothetical protein PGT21_014785 [Puccinia graminis f. sp. tritici]
MEDGQHLDKSQNTLNTLGQRSFLTQSGNEFLESIEQNHAILNKRVSVQPATNPATSLTTAVPSNASATVPVGLLPLPPKKTVIHKPCSCPTQYCLPMVQLEGMGDDVAAKRAHLKRHGSHEDADGSTDDKVENTDKQPSQGQVGVVLDNGLGRTANLQRRPNVSDSEQTNNATAKAATKMTVKAAKPLSTLGSPRTSDPLAGSQSSNSTEQPEQLPILIHNRKIVSMPVQISQPLLY